MAIVGIQSLGKRSQGNSIRATRDYQGIIGLGRLPLPRNCVYDIWECPQIRNPVQESLKLGS